MKRIVLVAAGVFALAACADPEWHKQDATAQDYTAAHDDCAKDGSFGSGVFGEVNWPSRYRGCMADKGWYEESQIWQFVSDMHN